MCAMRSSVAPTGTKALPPASVKRTPSAAAQPQPPSFVALPPRPSTMRRAPRASASAMSCPTP